MASEIGKFRIVAGLTYAAIVFVAVLFFEMRFDLDPASEPYFFVPYIGVSLFAFCLGWLLAPWHTDSKSRTKLVAAPCLVVVCSSLAAGVVFWAASEGRDFLGTNFVEALVSGGVIGYMFLAGAWPVLLLGSAIGVYLLKRYSPPLSSHG